MGRFPRKRLGQHFLADAVIARRIVALARLSCGEPVLEIGPGLGALTDLLAAQAPALWLVEVDADLADRLRARYADRPHVHVVGGDVLQLDLAALARAAGAPLVVVANLPYNIGTAVVAALLARPDCIARMVLMLQREVAERLQAPPGSPQYSALSVLTQLAANVRLRLRVPPQAFVPPPRVDSAVVVLEPHRESPVPVRDTARLHRLIRTVFTQRRKQLANSLRPLCADPVTALRGAGIDPRRRPETLTLAEFAALADELGGPPPAPAHA